jgi:GH25 family lysozyme M1 (1,4-beta-N-acetylmuramidase)
LRSFNICATLKMDFTTPHVGEDMATVPGIDVSYSNTGIDWPKVRAAGQRFTHIKASEGDEYLDPTFDDNGRGAKTGGLLRRAYHFFRANADAKKQANKFIDYVKSMNDPGELPPVLNLEAADGQSRGKIIARAKTWLDLRFGQRIIHSGWPSIPASMSLIWNPVCCAAGSMC